MYAVFGDKGNGLSSEFLDPVGTVRVLGPHAAAMIPLKYPRRYTVPTDPSKSLTCNDEKHKTGGALEALRKTWVVTSGGRGWVTLLFFFKSLNRLNRRPRALGF